MFAKTDIEKFFIAEKRTGALFFLGANLFVMPSLILLLLRQSSFYKGLALPSVVLGLIFGFIGYRLYKRSDMDRQRNVYAYDMNPFELKESELPRVKRIIRSFGVFLCVEIILLICGICLYVIPGDASSVSQFCKGAGISLALASLFALIVDYVSWNRAKSYAIGIASFIKAGA